MSHPFTLNVLTLNTWLLRTPLGFDLASDINSRAKLIPQKVVELGAEIVILQEVWHPTLRRELFSAFTRLGYPYSTWKEENEREIDRRDFLLKFGSLTKLKELSREIMQSGLIIFSKYPLKPDIQKLVFRDHTRADEVFVEKGAVKTQVFLPKVGWADLYNAHLGAVSFDGETQDFNAKECFARKCQTSELSDWIRKTQDSEFRIMGVDLNAHYHGYHAGKYQNDISEEFSMMICPPPYGAGLIDSFTFRNGIGEEPAFTDESKNPYKNSGHFASSPDAVLDYVFASRNKHFEPLHSRLVFNQECLSDHYGVLSSFALC